MSSMFYGCEKLETLDLPGFDPSSANNMSWMICGCTGLNETTIGDDFSFNSASAKRVTTLSGSYAAI